MYKSSLILLLTLFLFACNNPPVQEKPLIKPVKTPVGDNSRNALDWEGAYTGLLPCADCEGIQTLLVLNRDLTFLREIKYIGKSENVFRNTGAFRWDESGSRITLVILGEQSAPSYAVGENQLTQLDLQGKVITGNLAEKYLLKKLPALVEKYWKLIELNGNTLTPLENPRKEAHLILKATENRVTGNSGCNALAGSYALPDGNRISFSNIAATKMACPDDMETEALFFRTLESADNYSLLGDTLSLNKARMAPLARLVNVRLKEK